MWEVDSRMLVSLFLQDKKAFHCFPVFFKKRPFFKLNLFLLLSGILKKSSSFVQAVMNRNAVYAVLLTPPSAIAVTHHHHHRSDVSVARHRPAVEARL